MISVDGSDAPEHGTGDKKGILFYLKISTDHKEGFMGFFVCDMEIKAF